MSRCRCLQPLCYVLLIKCCVRVWASWCLCQVSTTRTIMWLHCLQTLAVHWLLLYSSTGRTAQLETTDFQVRKASSTYRPMTYRQTVMRLDWWTGWPHLFSGEQTEVWKSKMYQEPILCLQHPLQGWERTTWSMFTKTNLNFFYLMGNNKVVDAFNNW